MEDILRKENKYSLSMTDFYRLQPMLQTLLIPDPYQTDPAGYEVRSLYYDSADDRDLFDVLDGIRSKQKIRLRCYSAQAASFKLEYKCKTDTDSHKYSIGMSRDEAMLLLRGRTDVLLGREHPAQELYARMRSEVYVPRVTVVYRRIAYLDRLNDVRITFDYDIRCSLDPYSLVDPACSLWPVTMPASGILEVKYNGFLPAYVRTALGSLSKLQVANSKYSNSRLLF